MKTSIRRSVPRLGFARSLKPTGAIGQWRFGSSPTCVEWVRWRRSWRFSCCAALPAAQLCNEAVAATVSDSRYQDNGDDTVTDLPTSLIWKRCVEGLSGADCSTGSPLAFTWQQALQRAGAEVFAGSSLWRLPNKNELASLIEWHCYDPAINNRILPEYAVELVLVFVASVCRLRVRGMECQFRTRRRLRAREVPPEVRSLSAWQTVTLLFRAGKAKKAERGGKGPGPILLHSHHGPPHTHPYRRRTAPYRQARAQSELRVKYRAGPDARRSGLSVSSPSIRRCLSKIRKTVYVTHVSFKSENSSRLRVPLRLGFGPGFCGRSRRPRRASRRSITASET